MVDPSTSADSASFVSSGVPTHTGPFDVLVIGASFGGPKALEAILCALPRDFPLPIAVCQHITSGMTKIWAESLSAKCGVDVVEATDRGRLERGIVQIAPAGLQMRVAKGAVAKTIRLDPDFADSLHVPSVDVLFSSAADTFGSHTLAVILTGLGCDGASGMLRVREAGGYTIAESEQTALSYSMPGSAVAAGAIVEELPLDRIAERLQALAATS